MILFSVPIPSFSYSFPLWFIIGYWIKFPVLYNRILLIQPKCHVLHLLFPKSQSNPSLLSLTPQQPQVSSLCQRVCFISHKSICVWFLPQFSSVAQSCPTLCHPMNCSTPGLPVHHQFPESTQTHVCRVSDFFLVYGESVVISHWNHCFFGAFMCTLFFFFLIRFSNILTLSLPFFFFQMISILSENLSEGKWKLLRLADKLKKKFFF